MSILFNPLTRAALVIGAIVVGAVVAPANDGWTDSEVIKPHAEFDVVGLDRVDRVLVSGLPKHVDGQPRYRGKCELTERDRTHFDHEGRSLRSQRDGVPICIGEGGTVEWFGEGAWGRSAGQPIIEVAGGRAPAISQSHFNLDLAFTSRTGQIVKGNLVEIDRTAIRFGLQGQYAAIDPIGFSLGHKQPNRDTGIGDNGGQRSKLYLGLWLGEIAAILVAAGALFFFGIFESGFLCLFMMASGYLLGVLGAFLAAQLVLSSNVDMKHVGRLKASLEQDAYESIPLREVVM